MIDFEDDKTKPVQKLRITEPRKFGEPVMADCCRSVLCRSSSIILYNGIKEKYSYLMYLFVQGMNHSRI